MPAASRWGALVAVLIAALPLAGCPPTSDPMRDGGTRCTSTEQCNPSGRACGEIRLCVQSFCTAMTVIRACTDGGYPDAPTTGDCLTYQQCNPPEAVCGELVSCVNYQCDRAGPRIGIPCTDAGADASDGGASDAGDAARATDGGGPG